MRGARAKKLKREVLAAMGERGRIAFKAAKKLWSRGKGDMLKRILAQGKQGMKP